MSNVSAVTNHFPTANEGFITTLGGSILASAATVPLTSVSGLTNGTIFVGIIEPGQAKQQTFTGVVDTAGVQITGVKWTRGTDVDHTAGVTIVDYVSGTGNNMITKGILEHANQDGTLINGAISTTAQIGSGVVEQTNLHEKLVDYSFDFIASGCVWSGDAYASTRNASCTSGVVYLSGKRLTVAAVTARSFTASKDVYCDLHDNGDGTAVWVYTDNTTNAASPALTAGNLRGAIIVVGATNIAAAGSVNQGQEDRVLPIASSIPYAVTDSLGNLICPRDPQRKILGYKERVADLTQADGTPRDITGLKSTIIAPGLRKVEIMVHIAQLNSNPDSQRVDVSIEEDGVVIATSYNRTWLNGLGGNGGMMTMALSTPSAGLHTYSARTASTGTPQVFSSATAPSFISVKLA